MFRNLKRENVDKTYHVLKTETLQLGRYLLEIQYATLKNDK